MRCARCKEASRRLPVQFQSGGICGGAEALVPCLLFFCPLDFLRLAALRAGLGRDPRRASRRAREPRTCRCRVDRSERHDELGRRPWTSQWRARRLGSARRGPRMPARVAVRVVPAALLSQWRHCRCPLPVASAGDHHAIRVTRTLNMAPDGGWDFCCARGLVRFCRSSRLGASIGSRRLCASAAGVGAGHRVGCVK